MLPNRGPRGNIRGMARRYAAYDDSDQLIGVFGSRDAAAGAAQDAAREADSDGEGYTVRELTAAEVKALEDALSK
jgi:hypothetical protein